MPSLAETLQVEVDLIGRFVAVLNTEQDALRKGETHPLEDINGEKIRLVEQLNTIGNLRNQLLEAAGHTADRSGMSAWLAAHPSSQQEAALWNQTLSLAREAKELNRVNGQLISLRLKATEQAIDSLTVKPLSGTLYGRNGQAASATGHRLIDSA